MRVNGISFRQPIDLKTAKNISECASKITGIQTETCYKLDIPGIGSINILGKTDKKDIKYCHKLAKLLKKEAEMARRAGLTVNQTPILIFKDSTATIGDYCSALIGTSDIKNILHQKIRPILREYISWNEKLMKGVIKVEEYDKQTLLLEDMADKVLPGISFASLLEKDLDNMIQNYRLDIPINKAAQEFPFLDFYFPPKNNALYEARATKAVFISPGAYESQLKQNKYFTVLHEYGHSIFAAQKEINQFFPPTKGDPEDSEISRQLNFQGYCTAINELFADTCGVLTTKEPLAIEGKAGKAGSRDFSVNWPLDIWGTKEAEEKYGADFGDAHIAFNPVRSFIWDSVKNNRIRAQEILRKTVDFTVHEYEEGATSKENLKEVNKSLIDYLDEKKQNSDIDNHS